MRQTQIPALDALIAAATSINNPYLEKAKQEHRPIVGLFYQDLPEEVLSAAGCVPVMMRGTGATGTEFAEAYFRQLTCNYTRCTFNQIIEGNWDFLDAAVLFNNCDHMRRIYDNWKLLPTNKVYHFFYAPKKGGELPEKFFALELDKFIEATEKRFGLKITEEKLLAAIRLHNRTRLLQQQIYALQKGPEVHLTGTELLLVMLAGVSMPREDYNQLLEELIAALKANHETMKPQVRLLYTGGHVDNRKFFELLEQNGAQVVVDSAAFGTRSCEVLIDETLPAKEALCRYYMRDRPMSPRNFGEQAARKERLGRLVNDYAVDGVVMVRVSMCDLWAMEQFMTRDYLLQKDIPLLELEVDYLPEGFGQIATRVQAFIESIKAQADHS